LLIWKGLDKRCSYGGFGFTGSRLPSHGTIPNCANSELPVDEVDRALFAAATRVQVHNGKTARL
jgi:hypothetical protein